MLADYLKAEAASNCLPLYKAMWHLILGFSKLGLLCHAKNYCISAILRFVSLEVPFEIAFGNAYSF